MITSAAVTPDGRLGASGGYEGTARAWNLNERRQIACLSGHRSQRVRACTFEVYDGAAEPPPEAAVYFHGVDPQAGPLLKYTLLRDGDDPA